MQETQKKISVLDLKLILAHFLLCGIIYFLVSFLFSKATNMVLPAEINPVNCLPPILGILLGWPAYTACAIADFIFTITSGLSIGICFLSFFTTLIYGLLPSMLWSYFTRNDIKNRLRFNSLRKLIYFLITILVSSLINAILIAVESKITSETNIFSISTLYFFLNNIIFFIIIGFPVFLIGSIVDQKFSNKKSLTVKTSTLSINEKIILIFVFFAIILIICTTLTLYYNYKNLIANKNILWNKIYTTDLIILCVIFWVAFFLQVYIEKRITRPLEKMAKISNYYGINEDVVQSNEYVINLCKEYASYNSEIGDIARSYIYMASDSVNYFRDLKQSSSKNEDYEKDLLFANQIQKTLLPQLYPYFTPCSNVDIFGSIKFSKDFSGDFYDYFLIDEEHLAIIISDITGHGVEAALYMAIAKNLIKDKLLSGLLPEEAFTEINLQLSKDNSAGLFVSCWMGILTTSTGVLRYINAGQTQPIYLKKDENFVTLETPVDLALAASDETLYSTSELQLNSGDKLILYTRGITEAKNSYNETFGLDRLGQFFNRYKGIKVQELVEGLYREISLFAGSSNQENDYTVLALEYKNS